MAYLITPTMLNSFDWLKNAPSGYWGEKAIVDFENMLSRKYGDASPIMLLGNQVESTVWRMANTVSDKSTSPEFDKLVEQVKGSQYQVKSKRIIQVDGAEYLLYGKIDFLKSDLIIDMKVTEEYKGQDRYLSGSQHEVYCYCKGINRFRYVIAEIPDVKTKKIRDVFEVNWQTENTEELKQKICDKIREVMEYISKDKTRKDLYYNKFNLYS